MRVSQRRRRPRHSAPVRVAGIPWSTAVGWGVFAGGCLWAFVEFVQFDPAEWEFGTAGVTEKTVLLYTEVIRVLAVSGLGALILTAQPRNRAGLLCLVPVALPVAALYSAATSGADRTASVWSWSDQVVNVVQLELSLFFPVFFLPFFLPDGRLPRRRWWLVVGPLLA